MFSIAYVMNQEKQKDLKRKNQIFIEKSTKIKCDSHSESEIF